MGCCCCCCRSDSIMNPNIDGRDEIAIDTLKSVGLTDNDINKFYKKFNDVDLDGSGGIRHDEFFMYFRIEYTEINKRIFAVCDVDKSGVLNFCEFTLAIWNLLSMNSESVSTFIFHLFDDDNTGTLNFQEVRILVETIHHKKYETNKAIKKIVEQLRKISKTVSVLQFMEWARQNPPICAPVISLQHRLRVEIYGEGYWEELQSRRWRSGDKLAPNYILSVNSKYMAKVAAKKRLRDMNASLRQTDEADAPTASTADRKKAFERKQSSVASVTGIGDVIPDAPDIVPETIQRTVTKILEDYEAEKNAGTDPAEDSPDKSPKKKKKRKKKKKKAIYEKPVKIKFLPPIAGRQMNSPKIVPSYDYDDD